MTMIDEEFLAGALENAASAIDVSDHDVERAMTAARAPLTAHDAPRVVAALREHPRRRRVLAGAAVLVAVAAIAIPLTRSEPGAPATAALGARSGTPKTISGSGYHSLGAAGQSANTPYAPTFTNGSVKLGVVTSTSAQATSRTTTSSTKIESTGRVNLSVAKGGIGAALARLSRLVSLEGGSVVSSQEQSANAADGNFAYATVVLQVPQANFPSLVSGARRVGRVGQVTTSSVNVTGQYVDLKARIAALGVARRQYLAIMTRATTISDVLAVQARVNSLQSQIEQLQGQLNLLSHETTYANLTVNVTERGHHAATRHSSNGVTRAFHEAVHGFVSGVEWLVRSSGPALFALLCLGVLWLLGRVAWRAARRRSL